MVSLQCGYGRELSYDVPKRNGEESKQLSYRRGFYFVSDIMYHIPFLFLPKDELTIKKNHSKHILNTEPLW